MKVLLVGSGGREHALAWAISRSPQRPELIVAPGNAGIASLARLVPIPANDIDALADLAEREKVDLTVVGPEAPLVAGIVDLFRERGLRIFGPDRRAAQLEGSKVFAKDLMGRAGVPTASYEAFSSPRFAEAAFRSTQYPKVIKADGLAAGKGVFIVRSQEEALAAIRTIMVEKVFGPASERIVVEEFLEGEEVSVFALCRGREYFLLPASQDHKRLLENDEGPNTGGMGAYAPYPRWTEDLERRVRSEVIEPTLRAMEEAGRPYQGLLYFGLMIRDGRPFVLEYNCRFGDPETQAVLPLIEGDFLGALDAIADGTAEHAGPEHRAAHPIPELRLAAGAAGVVVLASRGYPGHFEKGFPIRGLEEAAALPNVLLFHAGTRPGSSGPLTDGGRVLGVTGRGSSLRDALRAAYEAVSVIAYEGKTYRRDIGRRGLSE
ncbi:MAG: phosphoribosylamine--glycine ligase [Candidatus Eisenbacteria bacterium]